ncbi:unnamed protein product [Auanema sp. JU1783]|nr:unnamed protein product [Auanema sp. JU1783]
MLVKSLVALATEKMLLKTSGKTFLRGIDFMYSAGLAPDRLSVMMTASGKYVLQFHSKCDIRPFAANYPSFTRVLRGIVHVKAWRIKSIEFVNVAFDIKDVDNLERTVEKLEVELVLLRNCCYPGVRRGDEAIRFLNALNRKKQAVVCEYGDIRLKHMISRQPHHRQSSYLTSQQVLIPPMIYELYRFLQNENGRVRRRDVPYAIRRRRNQNVRRENEPARAGVSPELIDLFNRFYDNRAQVHLPNDARAHIRFRRQEPGPDGEGGDIAIVFEPLDEDAPNDNNEERVDAINRVDEAEAPTDEEAEW